MPQFVHVLSRTTKPVSPVVEIDVGYLPMLSIVYDAVGPVVSNVARLLSNHRALVASTTVALPKDRSDLTPPPAAEAVTVRVKDSSTTDEWSVMLNVEAVEVANRPSTAAMPPAPDSTTESVETIIVDLDETVITHMPAMPLLYVYHPALTEVAAGVRYTFCRDNTLLVCDTSTTSALMNTATAVVGATFSASAVGYVTKSNVLWLMVSVVKRVSRSIAPKVSLKYMYSPAIVSAPSCTVFFVKVI